MPWGDMGPPNWPMGAAGASAEPPPRGGGIPRAEAAEGSGGGGARWELVRGKVVPVGGVHEKAPVTLLIQYVAPD